MLRALKLIGLVLSPFLLIFIYVSISSSGLVGNLPEDGELVYSPRPVDNVTLSVLGTTVTLIAAPVKV